jgi:hypothetical protein
LQVDSSSSTGSYAQTPPTWDTYQIEWPAGAASIQYYYRDYQTGTHTLTAMMDALRIPNSTQTTSQAIAQPFTITPQVLDHFIVTNISSPQTTDNKTSVVIMAADAKDYVVAGYDGTVRFLTSDPEGTVPQPYTFVPYIDKGLHTFVNGVSFKTPGEHTVTVIDDVHGVLGAQTSILVLGAAIPGPIETGDNPSDTSSPQPASPTSPTTSKGNPSSDGDKTGSRTPSVDNGTSQTPGTDSHAADAAHDADSPITSFFTRVEGAFHGKTPLHIAGVIAVILVAVWSLIRELRHIAFLGAIKKRQQKLRAEAQAKQISLAFMRPIEGITPDAILRPWYLRLPVYVPVFISIILTIALLRTIDHSTAQATVLFIASLLTAMAYTALRYRWLNSVDRAADNELNNEESYLLAQTTLS